MHATTDENVHRGRQAVFHPDHLADLLKSGLTAETISALGIHTVRPADIAKHLGFNPPPELESVLCFPYPNVPGFCRDKVFPALRDKDGHAMRYVQRKGSGVHLYVPPRVRPLLADPAVTLFLTEGEKKAAKATQEGFPCIGVGGLWCWSQGGKPIVELDSIVWKDRLVVLVPDSDVWGREDLLHAVYALGAELERRGATVRVWQIPGAGEKAGLDDLLVASGEGSLRDCHRLPLSDAVFSAARRREEQRQTHQANGRAAETEQEGQGAWPTLNDEALHGLPGAIVRALDPYTEADPVALLLNVLTAFGNCANAAPHARVQHDHHPARLFVVQVGDTSKGRKGTGWSTPCYLLSLCDPDWTKERIKSGLSSGEGLIYNVRDAVWKKEPVKEKGRVVDYQEVEADPGEHDKRLLVIEPEFASTLTVMARDGNILSAVIRQAWDNGTLSPLTRNNPVKATGAHISLVGHITKQELLARLDDTSKANGFANRFLWALVRRSKELPEGGAVPEEQLQPLAERLRQAIAFAHTVSEVKRDEEARALWAAVYHDLSEGKPGMLGAVLSRAEAQVLRLSLLYTLLDCSPAVRVEHLRAALAVWEYCERSAVLIFGNRLGDQTADRILEALRNAGPQGMTDNDIVELFGRNRSAADLARAKHLLLSVGLAASEKEETGGRPRNVWRATS